jgi:hypothetical protein
MVEKINNGDLDSEFRKFGGIGVPTMVSFKEKIIHGKSKMEIHLKKKEKRQAMEEQRLLKKLESSLPEIYAV